MKKYKSDFYEKDIEIENIDWEILVIITTDNWEKYIYSWYDIIEQESNSAYINKMLLWSFIKKIPEKVLILWSWWGALIKFLEDHIENIEIYGVDLDETMIKISKEIMWVKTKKLFSDYANKFLDELIKKLG